LCHVLRVGGRPNTEADRGGVPCSQCRVRLDESRRAVHALICVPTGLTRSHAPHRPSAHATRVMRRDRTSHDRVDTSTLSHNDQLQGARARAGAWITLEKRNVARSEEHGQAVGCDTQRTPSSAQAHPQSASRPPYTPRTTHSPCSSPPTRSGGAAAKPVITFALLPWRVGAMRGARSCAHRTRALAPPRLSER